EPRVGLVHTRVNRAAEMLEEGAEQPSIEFGPMACLYDRTRGTASLGITDRVQKRAGGQRGPRFSKALQEFAAVGRVAHGSILLTWLSQQRHAHASTRRIAR